jgi:hypothetical protein
MTDAPTPQAHLFISYSRRQFYFTESLVLRLQEAGIATWFDVQELGPGEQWRDEIQRGLDEARGLILIVSRASMASKYVQQEWEPMMAAGKPIYLVIFEAADVPQHLLDYCTAVFDFRGNFARNTRKLIATLQGEREPIKKRVPKPNPLGIPMRLPFTVSTIVITTFVTASFLLLTMFMSFQEDVQGSMQIGLTLMFGAWAYFNGEAALDLVRRQFTYRQVWIALISSLFLGIFIPYVLPVIALAMLAYYFSPGTYRWLPTGQAPNYLRARYGRVAAPTVREVQANLDQTEQPHAQGYAIYHAPEDIWIADQIESVLNAAGHQNTHHQLEADQHIVVLSNHTKVDFVEELLEKYPDTLTPIIANNVDSRGAVEGIGDFQAIDYRQHVQEQLEAVATYFRHPEQAKIVYGLNVLPLSSSIPRFPSGIQRFNTFNHMAFLLLVTVATFWVTVLIALMLDTEETNWLGYLILGSLLVLWIAQIVLHVQIAHGVQTRTITYKGFRRRLIVTGILSVLSFGFATGQLIPFAVSRMTMRQWLPVEIFPDDVERLPLTNQHGAIWRALRDGILLAIIIALLFLDSTIGTTTVSP